MTRLLRYWAPSVSEVEQTNRMKTKQYANGLEDDDVDVFCAARSVLYFVVKKAAWNRSVDEYTPESRVVKLHCNVPKFDIARECFSTEIEEASVEIVNEGCCINHGKIGAANVPVPLGSPFPKRLQNDQWLLVAILLHDYDVVFANYGKPVY